MISAKEEKISKQIQLTKHMPPDMKHIILANMNVKLYSWTLSFHTVVRQQISAEVVVLIQASSIDTFGISI